MKVNVDNVSKFITIEGGDGAGKSTFIPVIKDYLESLGHEVVLTREPGGTAVGERMRDMLLTHRMSVKTETLLMFGARAQHVDEVIAPALAAGKWVICDRFTDSTIAYQCYGKGFPESEVKELAKVVHPNVNPALTFVFDVPLAVSKARLAKTGKIPDKFESESDVVKENINQGYKNIVKFNPERCRLIDSSKSIQDTKDQVMLHLTEFVQKFEPKLIKKPKP